ncbi:hypothetical protein BDQ17DRAFT_1350292 [Cyathus striatus]|nr:hypothetical protein BDQ17DRAFT_1350292 [Cyathus striatus]
MSSIGPEFPPAPTPSTSISPKSAIGPEIPAQFLRGNTIHDDDDDEPYAPSRPDSNTNIGPQIPAHLLSNLMEAKGDDDGDDDDDYVPQLPPELAAKRATKESSMPPPFTPASSTRRPMGPTLPSYAPTYDPNTYYEQEDDDDDVGPKPLPAGMQHQETDAVKEFIEREERRKKQLEEAQNPKKLQRDEWMLVPPSSSDLLGKIDPTKLKPRQFSRNPKGAPVGGNDMSLWTETPQERQQRLADEVSGKKRRVTEQKPDDDNDSGRKRRKGDEDFIRKGVDNYTRRIRGPALVDQHTASRKPEDDDKKDDAIWDHARDMSIGGRLMDDDKRNRMIKESKGLSDRFGTGRSGGFL